MATNNTNTAPTTTNNNGSGDDEGFGCLIVGLLLIVCFFLFGGVAGAGAISYAYGYPVLPFLILAGLVACLSPLLIIYAITTWVTGWVEQQFRDIENDPKRLPPKLERDMFIKPANVQMLPVTDAPWIGGLLGGLLGDLKLPIIQLEPDEHLIRQAQALGGGVEHELAGWGIDRTFWYPQKLRWLNKVLPLGWYRLQIHWPGLAPADFVIDVSEQEPIEPEASVRVSPGASGEDIAEDVGLRVQFTANLKEVFEAREGKRSINFEQLLRGARRLRTSREGKLADNVKKAAEKACARVADLMTANQIRRLTSKGEAGVAEGKSANEIANGVYGEELAKMGLIGEITILEIVDQATVKGKEERAIQEGKFGGIADGLMPLVQGAAAAFGGAMGAAMAPQAASKPRTKAQKPTEPKKKAT